MAPSSGPRPAGMPDGRPAAPTAGCRFGDRGPRRCKADPDAVSEALNDDSVFDPAFLRILNLEVLAAMADAAPVALALIHLGDGPGDGPVLAINQAGVNLLDIAPEAAIGCRVGCFLAQRSDRRGLAARLEAEGRVDSMEVLLKAASGRRFWALVWAQPTRIHGQDLLVVSAIDISRQKQRELGNQRVNQ